MSYSEYQYHHNRNNNQRAHLNAPFRAPATVGIQAMESTSTLSERADDIDDDFTPFPGIRERFVESNTHSVLQDYDESPKSDDPEATRQEKLWRKSTNNLAPAAVHHSPYPSPDVNSGDANIDAIKNTTEHFDIVQGDDFYDEKFGPDDSDSENCSTGNDAFMYGSDEQEVELPQKMLVTRNKHLVIDNLVADKLQRDMKIGPHDSNEFRKLRYTAVTCGPSEFKKDFKLRQMDMAHPRETEIMICITLYDEAPFLVARTLQGVFQNIAHFTKSKEKTWGANSWKKIVVCLVADGRNKVNQKTLALFSALGLYQDGFARSQFYDQSVQAHLYEYTSKMSFKRAEENNIEFHASPIPVQLLLCLKESNKKKINSHRWCFDAFADHLKPRVVVLLDAGTQPDHDAIYHLWNAFERDEKVAGACGEIKAGLGPKFINLLNPLVASQNFEYKISNILDKPTESMFGFISVLPGAFSAYRYDALIGAPLEKYFKGEELDKDVDAGVFEKNMYLAEDRILCFELVTKRGCDYILKYVKQASAETDVPTQMSSLVKQRRRWLNGSFFASFYAVLHFWRIWTSGHSFFRKLWLQLEFVYQSVQLVVSWFSIASFFLVFRILTLSLEDYFGAAKPLAAIFLWIYVATTVLTFLFSFGNRPEGTSKWYFTILVFYAILMTYTTFAAIFISVKAVQDFIKVKDFTQLVFHNSRFRDLVISMSSTYVLYFVASMAYFEPWHMFTCFLQYLLVSPTYINVLTTYAFCNLHDLSWGNRDDTIKDKKLAEVKPINKLTAEELSQIREGEIIGLGTDEYLVYLDVPTEENEIQGQYDKMLRRLRKPAENQYRTNKFGIRVRKDTRTEELKSKDKYALTRTMVVFFWIATNVALIAGVMSDDDATTTSELKSIRERKSEIFLSVILWIVAFLAAFRFVGAFSYLIQIGLDYLGDKKRRRAEALESMA